MNNPLQEELLGYVLGALDAQEQRDLQKRIDQAPELEDQLLEIKASIVPLEWLDTSDPPPGLARRTCEMVARYRDQVEPPNDDVSPVSLAAAGTSSEKRADRSGTARLSSSAVDERRSMFRPSSWSLTDFMVTTAILVIVVGLLFPAVSYSRYHSHVMACQNNMRQVGTALMRYSESHRGQFVEIPRSGPLSASGCFAPILKSSGLIEDDQLFTCAGVGTDAPPVHIPSIEQVHAATGEQLNHLRRTMGGHFGYTMGYCDCQQYHPPQNMGRSYVVLLADMPSLHLEGRRSANHGGRGQNCLFEDGHVAFVRGDSIGEDAIFVNDYNLVAPGCCPEDNVIAPSHLAPIFSGGQVVPDASIPRP